MLTKSEIYKNVPKISNIWERFFESIRHSYMNEGFYEKVICR